MIPKQTYKTINMAFPFIPKFQFKVQVRDHNYYQTLCQIQDGTVSERQLRMLKNFVTKYSWRPIDTMIEEKEKTGSTIDPEIVTQVKQMEDLTRIKLIHDLTRQKTKEDARHCLLDPKSEPVIIQYEKQKNIDLDYNSFSFTTDPIAALDQLNQLVKFYDNPSLYFAEKELVQLLEDPNCRKRLYEYKEQSVFQDPKVQSNHLELYTSVINNFSSILSDQTKWDWFLNFERFLYQKNFRIDDTRKILKPDSWRFHQLRCKIDISPLFKDPKKMEYFGIFLDHIKPCNLAKYGILTGDLLYLNRIDWLQNAIRIINVIQQRDQERYQIYHEIIKRFDLYQISRTSFQREMKRAVFLADPLHNIQLSNFMYFFDNAVATENLCDFFQSEEQGLHLSQIPNNTGDMCEELTARNKEDYLWTFDVPNQYQPEQDEYMRIGFHFYQQFEGQKKYKLFREQLQTKSLSKVLKKAYKASLWQ